MDPSVLANGLQSGMVDDGGTPPPAPAGFNIQQGTDPTNQKALDAEKADVAKLKKSYDAAREFDKSWRLQVAIDRSYASGAAVMNYAVSANIIGSMVDILCAMLYARDPDVSGTKAPTVVPMGLPDPITYKNEQDMTDFARTMEIVVSRLWKKGKLKRLARKWVRSSLSVGEGWLKVVFISEKIPQPKMQAQLQDMQSTIATLQATQAKLKEQGLSTDDTDAALAEKERLIQTLSAQIEQKINKGLAIDFVPAENMQISTDILQTEDHLDAAWNGNEIYIPVDELKARFSKLTDDDVKDVTEYYLVAQSEGSRNDEGYLVSVLPKDMTDQNAMSFTAAGKGMTSENTQQKFARVIEVWDRRDLHIKTMIDGVKVWAVPPYNPPIISSRFQPYFRLAFYELDGSRHPQSLSFRLEKLQDEYCASRSSFRRTRSRSAPGLVANGTQLDDEQIRKFAEGVEQEVIVVTPTEPQTPLASIIGEKPYAKVDPRLYDNQPVLADMERISGVQEALQGVVQTRKTATEANIEQTGAQARTTSDRDALETVLNELALYTAECALQGYTTQDVQRIAGVNAFWPSGMAIEDIEDMVGIGIEAGTTGKPRQMGDRQAWSTALPMIEQLQRGIQQAQTQQNLPLANAMMATLRETMRRMGDESDADRFIPQTGPTPPPPPPPEPVVPNVNISLKGEVSPVLAQEIAMPIVVKDQMAMQGSMPGAASQSGAAPTPPGSPALSAGGSPPAPVPPTAGVPVNG